jgi:hypothetical protein
MGDALINSFRPVAASMQTDHERSSLKSLKLNHLKKVFMK